MNLNLSICVVTYNSDAYIERFQRELRASLDNHSGWEVLYFDNSPGAGTARILRGVCGASEQIFEDSNNHGFSYGSNRLVERSRFGHILLLNPDVFGFSPQFWSDLIRRATPGTVRFVRLLNEDGSYQDCVGRTSSLSRAFTRSADYAAMTDPAMVEMGIMAFMLASRAVFDRVGQLDESYPLFGEDMDWCYRANLQNIPLIYDPGLSLTHIGGASTSTRWTSKDSMRRKYAAERIFINKHYDGWYGMAMLALNRLKQLRATL